MPTIAEAVNQIEEQSFVGREKELALFRKWLTAEEERPRFLNVHGPGGVGKSALLAMFARLAERLGWSVVRVDVRDLGGRPEALLRALGDTTVDEVVERLNANRPLVLLDTVEELGALMGYLRDQLLPRLDARTRLVLAGRHALGVPGSDPWRGLLRPVPLRGFTTAESRAYLARRGIGEPALVEQVAAAAAGHPLALSLAADLVQQLGVRDLAGAPEWRLVVRRLVERLYETPDPGLQRLLEAGAVVRQFDEALLAAMTGELEVGPAFARLCGLSVVRPAQRGLMLHDDVRRILAEDLRWRNRARHDELRQRALDHYRERMRTADPEQRRWRLAERFYLWEEGLIQWFLFPSGDAAGDVWLEPARPGADDAAVLRVEAAFWRDILPALMPAGWRPALELDEHLASVQRLLDYPGRLLMLARDRDGEVVGFNLVLPVHRGGIAIIGDDPLQGPLLRAYLASRPRAELAPTAAEATTFISVRVAHTEIVPGPVTAALWRDLFGVFVLGGVYLGTSAIVAYQRMMLKLGGAPLPGAESWYWGGPEPARGYVIDLSRIGVEAWIEALIAGRPPPRAFPIEELERALQDALLHWRDDALLAASPLVGTILGGSAVPADPAALRALIRAAFERAQRGAAPGDLPVYRALELAYLEKSGSHERLAEQLAVSRMTFYRMLKRGVQGLTTALLAGGD